MDIVMQSFETTVALWLHAAHFFVEARALSLMTNTFHIAYIVIF